MGWPIYQYWLSDFISKLVTPQLFTYGLRNIYVANSTFVSEGVAHILLCLEVLPQSDAQSGVGSKWFQYVILTWSLLYKSELARDEDGAVLIKQILAKYKVHPLSAHKDSRQEDTHKSWLANLQEFKYQI